MGIAVRDAPAQPFRGLRAIDAEVESLADQLKNVDERLKRVEGR